MRSYVGGRVLVGIVCNDEPEVNILVIINHLHGRCLIVGPGPGPALILFKQDIGAVGAGTFRNGKFRIGKDRDARPLIQIPVEDNRVHGPGRVVEFLSGFDVISTEDESAKQRQATASHEASS